ncbi:MAG: hypothetical protein HQK54_18175, partial [Oligoflexales bacterium]|nr:hypothetical protein [Oligoflexales bacterium]
MDIEIYGENNGLCAIFKRLALKRIRSKELITDLAKAGMPEKLESINIAETSGQKTSIDDDRKSTSTFEKHVIRHKPLQTLIQEDLQRMISDIIKKVPTDISLTRGFYDQGLDSGQLLLLVQHLEKKIKKQLYPTLLFEYTNILELSEYLLKNHSEAFGAMLETEDDTKVETKSESSAQANREHLGIIRKVATDMDIAVIGLSGRYPGAKNLNEFWEVLKNGLDCITEVPGERWDYRQYFNADKESVGTTYSKWGGFIHDVDKFDARFFNISPREAELMDPQERLFLETVWETIEDSGYTRRELGKHKTKTGVFVGVMWGQYQLFESRVENGSITPVSTYASIANRVSYCLDLKGPSMAIDTMCSSSLTAIHLACQSLYRGECGYAIAGGVNVTIHPNKYLFLSNQKFASTDGRCRSFGEGGDGYVPGEGVGAVVLKPLKEAVEDRDHIYGVIKGSVLNHGGKSSGYSVPNPNAQSGLISEALRMANIDARTISYVEAHGTGTALGDPIEFKGLVKSFEEYTGDKGFCSIGSVKSNIGHLESAAGIAGVTKVLLQMKHRKLVPSIHSEKLNPVIDFESSPFYVQRKFEEWKRPIILESGTMKTVQRRAGISSFGAGGSNAHILIEEYIDENMKTEGQNVPGLMIFSAKSREKLIEYARRMVHHLEKYDKEYSTIDMAFTLQAGREEMEE